MQIYYLISELQPNMLVQKITTKLWDKNVSRKDLQQLDLLLMLYIKKDTPCPIQERSWTFYFPYPFLHDDAIITPLNFLKNSKF